MTRTINFAASLALAAAFAGCASTGSDDDVAVVTAELDGQSFELVEMHDADFIEIEVYYSAGQAEEIADHFRWQTGAPTPTELVDILAQVDPDLLENATPLSDDAVATVSIDAVWPRLLQEARLAHQLGSQAASCGAGMGLTDCLRQN